ncbi:VWA domain-containing protein [Zavarzinella formosa]|uniref:VWA domain-containing protein n=1 Tax=Zavarzinella formosa TaxID=360055 RepID=UPI0003103EC1|nr:VWA domain-containing protein [Zavarzinella formosa]
MAQLKNVQDPFGEVNVKISAGGKVKVSATILMDPHKEGAQTGIALDGSGSMSNLYGINSGGALSSVFAEKSTAMNIITPVAQKVCAYLARKIDADGGTTCIYWATGPAGSEVQVVGDLTADEAERHVFNAPTRFGTGTQLLPAVKYFVERFKDAPWGFYVFVTDGAIHDLDEVKEYTEELSSQIFRKKRNPVKFVLIGVGREADERQMEELDDLDTEVDLWDHKLASEMRALEQIFAEVVDKNARVAPTGRILDPKGNVLKDYSDVGLPAFLEFEAPASAMYFTLEVPGFRLHQGLMDGAKVPSKEDLSNPAPQSAIPTPPPPVPAKESPKPEPKAEIPVLTPIPAKPVPKPEPVNPDKALENLDELEPTIPGLDFKLEFDKDQPGIDLDKRD